MDVTFVLEESGVTATVEVPCEANVAAAKEVACTALAVSPASVEMRIGTQVLEGTCRLQDTAFDAGVQVVLACPRLADIKCPADCIVDRNVRYVSLSRCGSLCIFYCGGDVSAVDTETFDTVFSFNVEDADPSVPAISQCKTRCYLMSRQRDCFLEVALPGGEVVRKVDGTSLSVFACGSVVVSQGKDGVSVYDEDLTLLRFLSHEGCRRVALSDCGGWVISFSEVDNNARVWDVETGEAVICVTRVPGERCVALSSSASVFAVVSSNRVQLYDWSGMVFGSIQICGVVSYMQFTPCGKYLVVKVDDVIHSEGRVVRTIHQYDVETLSCVRVFTDVAGVSFALSPCSRVVVFGSYHYVVTRHLYPHNE